MIEGKCTISRDDEDNLIIHWEVMGNVLVQPSFLKEMVKEINELNATIRMLR